MGIKKNCYVNDDVKCDLMLHSVLGRRYGDELAWLVHKS